MTSPRARARPALRSATWPYLAALAWALGSLAWSAPARGEDDEPRAEKDAADEAFGWHLESALAFRPAPLGAFAEAELGYRAPLWDADGRVLGDAYVEPGAAFQITPSTARGGLYLEALPLAVLELRIGAQATRYLGAWGYLHLPADPDAPEDWSLGELGGGAGDGAAGSAVMVEASVTPQVLVGRWAALAETKVRWARASVDQRYYEPSYDMLLEPSDGYWVTRPTVGRVFPFEDARGWILAGARWEHARSVRSGVVRDLAAAVGMWNIPWDVLGEEEMLLGVVAGYWARHPNRDGTLYGATQLSLAW